MSGAGRPVLRVFLKSAKGRVFARRHRGEELVGKDSGARRPVLRVFLKSCVDGFRRGLTW